MPIRLLRVTDTPTYYPAQVPNVRPPTAPQLVMQLERAKNELRRKLLKIP
jgi:hypothetical protein